MAGDLSLARIIHEQVNNPPFDRLRALRNLDGPSGLRLRGSTELAEVPAIAGRRSGLALSPSTLLGILSLSKDSAAKAACRRIIHEGSPFVNNAG